MIFKMKRLAYLILCLGLCYVAQAQHPNFSRADSLRGGLNPQRICFNVLHYTLDLRVLPDEKRLQGSNTIRFEMTQPSQEIQLDLFANMEIQSIAWKGKRLSFRREANAVFVSFPNLLKPKEIHELMVTYQGQPRAAVRPPWDGGFSWTKDRLGRPWITVSCEGLGASAWWPCKDHPSDEPEQGVDVWVEVPKGLSAVSNGQFLGSSTQGNWSKSHWRVSYPINLYNVSLNIAHYQHWSEELWQYNGEKLALNYYVLDYNQEKARAHFQQSREMLLIFEKYFGPYPFPKDGYALVETDYWGMEHQSAVAYGNHYQNNAYGFDFIIIHESAHEWFGNSISCSDHADLWIHEALATYAEAIYLEEKRGKEVALQYLNGQKKQIRNQYPIVGPKGVNYQHPDSDMYFKGSWMFHTLRQSVQNDAKWFACLKKFCQTFYHKNTHTDEVLAFFKAELGPEVMPIFERFLFKKENPFL